jgi:hypothetical protein
MNGAACTSIHGGSGEQISLEMPIRPAPALNVIAACTMPQSVVFSHSPT